jgi:hypothetical protein
VGTGGAAAQQGELPGDERAAAAAGGGRGEPGVGAVEVLVGREPEQVRGDGAGGDGEVAVAGAEGVGRLDEPVHAGRVRDGEVPGDPGGARGPAEAAAGEADADRGAGGEGAAGEEHAGPGAAARAGGAAAVREQPGRGRAAVVGGEGGQPAGAAVDAARDAVGGVQLEGGVDVGPGVRAVGEEGVPEGHPVRAPGQSPAEGGEREAEVHRGEGVRPPEGRVCEVQQRAVLGGSSHRSKTPTEEVPLLRRHDFSTRRGRWVLVEHRAP